uniref:Uncharacterized protein n=1 Tax=Ananas comosus var. bracteatus TaxID=296719 RepID=A0A6V7P9Q5_ANACO|nr:unnamed protein product [Ananas comosus var. bracteatus]
MSTSDAEVVDVGGDPPKQPSKRSKSKDPQRITRDSASLEDRLVLLEDIIAKIGERYTEMADTFNSFNEDVHSMEESVTTAMEIFRSEIEKLQANMKSRDEERKKLIEELVARVDEVEDLKTRVTILEKASRFEQGTMSTSDAEVVDVRGDPPKQPSKRSKSKDPQRITRDSASLEDRLVLLEDIIAKMGERYTEMADTFNSFNEDVHSMEESVTTAMEIFRSEIEKLQANMKSRDEERKKLIEELVARVDEVEDLKTRVTILEKADCPNRSNHKGKQVAAVQAEEGKDVVELPRMGALKLVNAVRGQPSDENAMRTGSNSAHDEGVCALGTSATLAFNLLPHQGNIPLPWKAVKQSSSQTVRSIGEFIPALVCRGEVKEAWSKDMALGFGSGEEMKEEGVPQR